MKKPALNIILLILSSLFLYNPGFCLEGRDIARMSKAGIDGDTLQVILREKVIETCTFTVEEILDLKKSGMSNKTIRMVVESASLMKDTEPIEYGNEIRRIKFATVKDIIALKNAGISDKVIEAIISGTQKEDDEEHRKAWEMLKNMGVIIDDRSFSPSP